MSIAAVRLVEFDAGHRVHGHESKCARLHGHRYRVELHAAQAGGGLDSLGRVVDFSVLKERIGTWLDERWDHRTLLWCRDPLCEQLLLLDHGAVVGVPFNPTAENMAAYLLQISGKLLSETNVRLTKVVVWETPNCRAEVVDD
ncbi:MAG: 6-pyruvoyl tetrahydrobiopterin synthase [Arthrobacter sp.]|jgi:6-pyruvoyltetrahydropterin/6-carboxytetrahydropterin synthase|nr:6-pyruvoyl tetrahydrobiopterin synthase [Arthrobacter sp.]